MYDAMFVYTIGYGIKLDKFECSWFNSESVDL